MIKFNPIGYIRSGYQNNALMRSQLREDSYYLELDDKYIPALKYLNKFDYIYVLYYMDRIDDKDKKMQITENNKNIGIFATYSPLRPNPIGLSIVKLIRIEENKIYISNIDAFPNSPILDIKPYLNELDLKDDANSGLFREDNRLQEKIYLYTDGACSGNPGPGGYAALIIKGNNEIKVTGYNPETTNNRMEMLAVIEGFKKIKEGSKVTLVSDSNYVLQGLNKWLKDWKKRGWKTASNKPVKNKDLWLELNSLINKYKIDYVKVKGHSGHKYNERVDMLAREEIEKAID